MFEHDAQAPDPSDWEFGEAEYEAIERHAAGQRRLDRDLAAELEEAEPGSAPVTTEYLRGLGRRPRLGPAQERELVRRAHAGDAAAREQLIEAYLPLVAYIARMYRNTPRISRVELIQEGVVGLLRALERFEPERGTPFWGYAAWWVRQAMQQLIAELTRPVVLSDRALRQLSRIKDVHRSYLRTRGREPTNAEIVAATELTGEQVSDLVATDRSPRALEEPVHADDGDVGTFGDLLADPLAEGEYEEALAAIEIQQLRSLLSGLSDREREVLRARYGLDGEEQTLGAIGAGLGLSAERVRQIEQRALGKLRAAVQGEQ